MWGRGPNVYVFKGEKDTMVKGDVIVVVLQSKGMKKSIIISLVVDVSDQLSLSSEKKISPLDGLRERLKTIKFCGVPVR